MAPKLRLWLLRFYFLFALDLVHTDTIIPSTFIRSNTTYFDFLVHDYIKFSLFHYLINTVFLQQLNLLFSFRTVHSLLLVLTSTLFANTTNNTSITFQKLVLFLALTIIAIFIYQILYQIDIIQCFVVLNVLIVYQYFDISFVQIDELFRWTIDIRMFIQKRLLRYLLFRVLIWTAYFVHLLHLFI